MKMTTNSAAVKEWMFTVSIVTYNPDLDEFSATLSALNDALSFFDPSTVAITIVDNSNDDMISPIIEAQLTNWKTKLINGHGNIGFGRGHNLALPDAGKFHLILNPDIETDRLALQNAIAFMQANPNCGLLSPRAYWPNGKRQYLCKRYPAAFDLLLRGFAPASIQNFFNSRMARYEMRYETQNDVYWDPPIVSGCFMLFQGKTLEKAGGFDPGYLLYFEDFDLSIRARKHGKVAYVPSVKITHAGGHAAKKGSWHIWQLFKSGLKFYRDNGFRFI